MKPVNATVCLYEDVEFAPSGTPTAFKKPFNGIVATDLGDGRYSIGNFTIVTQFCLLGHRDANQQEGNIVHQKGILDVQIQLTKFNESPNERKKSVLDTFAINTGDPSIRTDEECCFPFVNYTRTTRIGSAELYTGPGTYIIKVVVKNSKDTEKKCSIQAMYSLDVQKPQS